MDKTMKILDQIDLWLEKIEKTIGTILLIVMSIAAFVQVIFRYVLEMSIMGTEELARYCMIYLVFLGTALAVYRKSHISLDALTTIIKNQTILKVLMYFLDVVAFFVMIVFSVWSWEYLVYAIQSGQKTVDLEMPYWIPISSLFVAGIFSCWHLIVRLLKGFLSFIQNKNVIEDVGEGA